MCGHSNAKQPFNLSKPRDNTAILTLWPPGSKFPGIPPQSQIHSPVHDNRMLWLMSSPGFIQRPMQGISMRWSEGHIIWI